jgi:diguanylate cyclase (GGDEF)-like protein
VNRKFIEIDETIRGLNQSTDAHFKWLVKVLRFIANGETVYPEITCSDAHHYCEFGHWLNMKLAEEREDKNFLLDINKKHIAVHAACRHLVKTIARDSAASSGYDGFENALLAFTEALSRYKVHLLQLRTSYDALTGLPLRRVLDEAYASLNNEFSETGLYLLLLDVDHFKKVNDDYGHLNGDIVLRAMATHLDDNIRLAESVYRYGGEEFIILLQTNNDTEAISSAERLRQLIAKTEITAPCLRSASRRQISACFSSVKVKRDITPRRMSEPMAGRRQMPKNSPASTPSLWVCACGT